VANLPTTIEKTSPAKIQVLIDHATAGRQPQELARKIFPGQGKMARRRRRKFVRECYVLAATDERFQQEMALRAKGKLIWNLDQVVEALVRRSINTGRPDAIKLALEATGFHNPRVQHEHSGEIKVKLEIPRPPVLDDEGRPEKVVDADVVED
jgi:hypothetical protein